MNVPVPQQGPMVLPPIEELYRQYGEATVQFKLAQGKLMQLEQMIQQAINSPQQPK